jgi:hypothetical protein
MPMTNSYTSYLLSVDDEVLVSQIKSVFQRESENQRPSRNVMQFLLGYAAAYDTVNTGLMGQVAYMNN